MSGLRAEGVCVQLSGRIVLRDAELAVARGEVVALLAPSGAGKSTLLRALVGLVPVDTGRIALDGASIASVAPTAWRRRVGLVAQQPVMLPGTVSENLRYGVDGAGERDALADAGLDESFSARFAAELSGGERARVAVARALTRAPEILLLDEPTAALDEDVAEHIGATLRRLRDRGLGVAVTTHDRVFAERWSDRIAGL